MSNSVCRNFMNDSLRTDVFVRYPPETIAVACIYLSARKLKVALPKNPTWFQVLAVEEDDIKECCYSMICLYNRKKVCRTNPLHVITIFIFWPTLCNTVGFLPAAAGLHLAIFFESSNPEFL